MHLTIWDFGASGHPIIRWLSHYLGAKLFLLFPSCDDKKPCDDLQEMSAITHCTFSVEHSWILLSWVCLCQSQTSVASIHAEKFLCWNLRLPPFLSFLCHIALLLCPYSLSVSLFLYFYPLLNSGLRRNFAFSKQCQNMDKFCPCTSQINFECNREVGIWKMLFCVLPCDHLNLWFKSHMTRSQVLISPDCQQKLIIPSYGMMVIFLVLKFLLQLCLFFVP